MDAINNVSGYLVKGWSEGRLGPSSISDRGVVFYFRGRNVFVSWWEVGRIFKALGKSEAELREFMLLIVRDEAPLNNTVQELGWIPVAIAGITVIGTAVGGWFGIKESEANQKAQEIGLKQLKIAQEVELQKEEERRRTMMILLIGAGGFGLIALIILSKKKKKS